MTVPEADQLPVDDPIRTRVWEVVCGSGMGMLCAPDVSDVAFSQMVEQWLTPAVRAKFGVELYVRYKDDGFIALNADPDVRFDFFMALKARARFFVLELDSISDFGVTMLDTFVYKGAGWARTGFLDYRVHVKRTSVWVPLRPSSGHAPGVHASWPAGLLHRHRLLCSETFFRDEAASLLLARLRGHGVFCAEPQGASSVFTPDPVGSRIILPWRPQWQRAQLARLLAVLSGRFPELGAYSRVGIAWSLAAQHVVFKIRGASVCPHVAS